jgi:Sulfotransferase family
MTIPPPLGGVAFGCVAEATPPFYSQVLRLVQSIRWFGGTLADASVFACFVDEVDPVWRAQLESLGAHVRVVQPFNPLNRFSNKVRFLELPELSRYETAVLLDCDMALVQDPAPYLAQPALQLMIADLPTVPSARLAQLCAHFGLATPALSYRTTCSQEPTIWYCNTGVTILPTAWIARILPAWREFILRLCAEPTLLDPPYHHCNQAAMTLTYIADPLPFVELPVAMNFPLNQAGRHPTAAMLREDPVILHYHDLVGADGLLLPSPYPLAQARIKLLNQRLGALRPATHALGDEQRAPIPFIVGAAHSGAALLCQILRSHPDLAIAPATHFIPAIARDCQRSAHPAERFVEHLTQHTRWPDFQIETEVLRGAIASLRPFSVSAGLRAFYQLCAERAGKPHCGDGTITYGHAAEQIQLLLPEARFIHLVRDIRDVARSNRTGRARQRSLARVAQHWAAQMRATRRQAPELQHYLEVRYAALVEAPEATLRRICAFLDLAWDPALLQHYERSTAQPSDLPPAPDQASIHRPSHPHHPRRSIRRRRVLSPGDRAIIEATTGETLGELGYPLTLHRAAPPRCVVCITGMHRSGTSLVGQILHACGPYLGPYRQLAASAADNLDGYWEHPDMHQLNEEILSYFGGGWDLVPSLPEGWEDLAELEPLRQRARAHITQFDGQRFWGWKDPRSALTLPFWRKLIPGLKVVICMRSPLEVAQSLGRRGMSSLAFGMRLWQTYNEHLLATVAPNERIITHYERYFVDAAAETQRVLTWLNIPFSPALVEQACRAASADLRHERSTAAHLLTSELPPATLHLYNQLCDEASTHARSAQMHGHTAPPVDHGVARASGAATRRDRATAAPRAYEAEIAGLKSALTTLQTKLGILQYILQARDAEAAFLKPTLVAREAEIANYAHELAALHELLAAREAEIANYAHELAALHELLAAREAEIANYAHELALTRDLLRANQEQLAAHGPHRITGGSDALE